MTFLTETDPLVLAAMAAAFGAAWLLAYIGGEMFGKGWESYEEKYVKGAERTMESMFLTIPIQNLVYLSAMAFLFIMFLVAYLTSNFWAGVVFGMFAFSLPKILLVVLKMKRDNLYNLQLIDALSSASNSLRAGLTLNQSFDLIQQEMDSPIDQEFRLVNQQLRLGLSLEDALEDLRRRMPGQDTELFVTATVIARDIGGNLPEVFAKIAETIRERHKIEGKIRALTAQGKAQAAVICLLPLFIGLALNFITPDLFRPMYQSYHGLFLILLIILMELAGAYFIRRIVIIDV